MPTPTQDPLQLLEQVRQIVDRDDLSWRAKYDLVFRPEVSGQLCDLLSGFSFCDPDMDYRDDVTAFLSQLEDYLAPESDR